MDRDSFRRKIWNPIVKVLNQSESDRTLLTAEAQRLEKEFGEYLKEIHGLIAEVVMRCEQLELPAFSKQALADITALKSRPTADLDYLSLLAKAIRSHCACHKGYQKLCGTSYNGFGQRLLGYLIRLRKRTGSDSIPFNVLLNWFGQAVALVKMRKESLSAPKPLWSGDSLTGYWSVDTLATYWNADAFSVYLLEQTWIREHKDLEAGINSVIRLFRTVSNSFRLSEESNVKLADTSFSASYEEIERFRRSFRPLAPLSSPDIPIFYSIHAATFEVLGRALSLGRPQSKKELEHLLSNLSAKEIGKSLKIVASRLAQDLKEEDWFYESRLSELKKARRKFYQYLPFSDDERELFIEVIKRYYERVADVSMLCNLLNPIWSLSGFYIEQLRADQVLGEKVLLEFIKSLDFEMLAGIGFPAYRRLKYSFGRKENVAILFRLAQVKQGERLLDMFGNVPRVSIGAVILGAKVIVGDIEYESFEDWATYRAAIVRMLVDRWRGTMHSRGAWERSLGKELDKLSDYLTRWLLPQESAGAFPVSFHRVNPANLIAFSHNFFVKFASPNLNIVRCALPWKEEQTFGIPFEEGVFDKIIVDPPYGVETAREEFKPPEYLFIAKSALEEANRVVREEGFIVVSLPPERWEGKWLEIAKLRWREEIAKLGAELGLEFVLAYEQGRGIVKAIDKLKSGRRALVMYRKSKQG